PTTRLSPLSLHDALPISRQRGLYAPRHDRRPPDATTRPCALAWCVDGSATTTARPPTSTSLASNARELRKQSPREPTAPPRLQGSPQLRQLRRHRPSRATRRASHRLAPRARATTGRNDLGYSTASTVNRRSGGPAGLHHGSERLASPGRPRAQLVGPQDVRAPEWPLESQRQGEREARDQRERQDGGGEEREQGRRDANPFGEHPRGATEGRAP